MEYRKIGESGLELSAITFGAWAAGGWMWGGTARSEAVEAIRTAYDLGVTSIDTAPIYGMGASEEIVAEAIRDIGRSRVQLLTKFGMRWDDTRGDFAFKGKADNGQEVSVYKYAGRQSIIKECDDSLRRLKTDYIDLYQLHWPDTTTPIPETMETLAQLVKEGKVRYAGVCNYSVAQMQEAQKYIALVSNQVPYSMVKRNIEKDVVPYCLQNHTSILAYSPLERGLLTGKMKPGHTFAEGDHRARIHFYTDENLTRITRFMASLQPLADEKNASLSQLVIRWTLEQPGITIALVGARNKAQAQQNAKAIDVKLSSAELGYITAEVQKLELVKPTAV